MLKQLNFSLFFLQVFSELLKYQKQPSPVSRINKLGQGSVATTVQPLPAPQAGGFWTSWEFLQKSYPKHQRPVSYFSV